MRNRHLLVVDAAVPVVVALVVVAGEAVHGGEGIHPVAFALGIGAALSLAGRRRWPGWTLAVTGALVAVLFHLDRSAATVAVLAPAVALYSLALRRGRRWQITAGVLAVAAVVAADIVHPGRLTVGQTLAHALLVAIPLLAAEVIRTHQANVSLLTERLALAEHAREQEAERRAEAERMRIARDLHDVVAHTLTEINVTAAAAAERSEASPARTALERIESASHAAISELRSILGVLRDRAADAAPRTPAPRIDDITELVDGARRSGTDVRVDIAGEPRPVSDVTALAAYRIVQEGLTNARRHAAGSPVSITLRYDTKMLTAVIRNKLPNNADASEHRPGIGLVGMRERAEAIGGRLSAGVNGAAFLVCAELPYEPAR